MPVYDRGVPLHNAGQAEALLLRPTQAARLLGISPRKLWGLTKNGKVPHVRIGRATLYPTETIRRWLEAQTRGGSTVTEGGEA